MLETDMSRTGIRWNVLASLLGAVCAAAVAAAAAAPPPPGATARCRDGSYSFSRHHSGTCSHHGGVAVWLDTPNAGGATSGAGAAASRSVGATVLLQPRTRTSSCRRGPEPDRRCSPGAFYSGLTRAVICSSGFRTSSIRNVPQEEKFAVEREYGMRPAYYGRSIEIDHIVSLELGGSNDMANLFPEPGAGSDDYHAKDRLENRLHDMVCAGQIGLRAAQRGIAGDWESLYRRVFETSPGG
jgi:hypothetical protein